MTPPPTRSYLVNFRTGEPLKRSTLFGALAALYAAAAVVGFAGATQWVSPNHLIWFVALAWFGPMIAIVPLITRTQTRWGWIAVVCVFGGLVAILPAFFAPPSILAARGIPIHATITDAERMVEGDNLLYSLETPGAVAIPGLLQAHDGYQVGERVDIVYDPGRLVHPMLAQELEGQTGWSAAIVLGPVFGLQLLFCWFAARPRREPLDEATPWLQPGLSGRAILEGMPWWQLGFGAFLVILSLFLLVPAWDNMQLSRNGIPGTVHASECDPHYGDLGIAESWTCSGPFTSDDGALRIARVVIEPDLAHRPTAPVAAKVAGANATVASTDPAWKVQFFGGLVMFAIGAWRMVIGVIYVAAAMTDGGRDRP